MAKPKTHIEDPTQDAPKGGCLDSCARAIRPSARAGGQRRSVVPEMPPVPPLASPDERPSRAKGRLRPSGSPRSNFKAPLNGLSAASRGHSRRRIGLPGIPRAPASSEVVNLLFPQACVNLGSFPRPFTTTLFNPVSTIHHDNCPKSSTIHHDIHIVKTSRRFTSSRSGYSCG